MPLTLEERQSAYALTSFQDADKEVESIAGFVNFVVVYLLDQDEGKWQKADIEGPCYVVRRKTEPLFQIHIKNQASGVDLQDNLHSVCEIDLQNNYLFYNPEDPMKRIRGLWCPDTNELSVLADGLKKAVTEVKSAANPGAIMMCHVNSAGSTGSVSGRKFDALTLSHQGLRDGLHNLVEDDFFINGLMNKLGELQSQLVQRNSKSSQRRGSNASAEDLFPKVNALFEGTSTK